MRPKTVGVGVAGVLAAITVVSLGLRAREAPAREDGRPIRVEVLNGSGVYRAGLGLAEELRSHGFDVVDVRNADRRDYAETIVLDRVGVDAYALEVAGALGVPGHLEQQDSELLLEVTVILGRDRGQEYGGRH